MNLEPRLWWAPMPAGPSELTVKGLGIRETMPPHVVHRPSGLGDFVLFLFHDPVLVCDTDGVGMRPAHTFVLWRPGESQYYGHGEAVWSHSWICCDGILLANALATACIPHNEALCLPKLDVFDWYLDAIHREITQHASPDMAILANFVANLALEIGRQLQDTAERLPNRLLELRSYLQHNYMKPLALGELAGRACLSESHLCKQFRRYFGVPPMTYLLHLRMRHAARLLCEHNRRVGEIAFMVGFSDIYYFSRFFKRYYGESPRAFREKLADPSTGPAQAQAFPPDEGRLQVGND